VRTSGNQTVYPKKSRRSLVQLIQKIQTDILILEKQVDNQDCKNMILCLLKDTTIDIRKCLFTTYRGRKGDMEAMDTCTIDSGNLRALTSDMCLDVCLFKNHSIEYDDPFSTA